MCIASETLFKRNNFVCKSILGIKEIQANDLIEGEPTQNAPNLGQVTSGSCQSRAGPYIQGHTLQGFKLVVKGFRSRRMLQQLRKYKCLKIKEHAKSKP
jgi:hypothetical protein